MKKLHCLLGLLFIGFGALAQGTDTTRNQSPANTSFDAGSLMKPLYVLDGKIYGGNINTLNTDDIKSITVLKSPDAVKRYGAGGANGVIMIETKANKTYLPMQPQSSKSHAALPDSVTYVVDGVVTDKSLEDIDSQDIESIRVVNNNTATPVIGVANGKVIMVTTKGSVAKKYKQALSAASPAYKKYLDAHNNDDSALNYTVDGTHCDKGLDCLARLSNLTKENILKVKFSKPGTEVAITTKK
ncbi:TonB-dependent receptor plug domain-containing protein [Mucilaginibacter sp. L3T2-6]|uniref:TonB-dependent receptor plug domain-containing protein n=1 Tax=Mucilaginibacter sp. L3T2-6 TaxID=3062491 RepID=UPI002676F9E8|nr:TonB-dependent receptor plug domain-containing protein [Mucilaginibacter sp. L3T2-6]MDO3644526.1 TonB-dependent receptor plug domain-containing protein [Mucilaginibacter sp. L3T2-6]MDV6216978.1 TonB-dependent receptor plug domain-containing protein [Mucilaginibacter sp. L3T2-6]